MGNLSLQGVCEQLPPVGHVLIWIAVLVWEYGFGKTKWGSTAGLMIETPIKKILNLIKVRLNG